MIIKKMKIIYSKILLGQSQLIHAILISAVKRII